MLNRDDEYLGRLRDYYAQHRVLPSFTAICRLLGLKSTSSVAAMARRMQETGHLESGDGGRLQPGPRFFDRDRSIVPVLAGTPESVSDAGLDAVAIDGYLIDEPSRTLLVPVKGQSMVAAGLLPGDTVVVKRGAPAKAGDIVVARVDGEFTVKYLAQGRSGFYLKPGNVEFDDIRPKDELEIVGRVTGSFRKY